MGAMVPKLVMEIPAKMQSRIMQLKAHQVLRVIMDRMVLMVAMEHSA